MIAPTLESQRYSRVRDLPHFRLMEQRDRWEQVFDLWLKSRGSDNTRQAYRIAWKQLKVYCGKEPGDLERIDVARWAEALREQQLSPETINQRLAAISSFYTYAKKTIGGDGMVIRNPVKAVARPKREAFRKARYLVVEEVRALLRAIPQYTMQGKRDYALFLMYLATGRRNGEIRKLKWSDFETQNGRVWYRWRGKGKQRKDECPGIVWDAIKRFVDARGIGEDGYVFTPLSDNATRLANVSKRSWSKDRPLSACMVGKLLKKYCRLAGLDAERVTVHTLRHTAAMLRKQAGDDLEGISAFLGHSSLAVTQVYLHKLEGQEDHTWAKVGSLLGLGS